MVCPSDSFHLTRIVFSLSLEEDTPTTASLPVTSTFIDSDADTSTTTYQVTLDPERGVYALEGIPQPTVQVPRGDILKFNVSALDNPGNFIIFGAGQLLTVGVNYGATEVTVDTGSISNSLSKIYYRDSVTAGLGWVIEITDN